MQLTADYELQSPDCLLNLPPLHEKTSTSFSDPRNVYISLPHSLRDGKCLCEVPEVDMQIRDRNVPQIGT